MNTNKNFNENFNELVFENRNKEYGAYVLRTKYNENVSRSLLITCAFFGVLTLLGIILSNTKMDVKEIFTGGGEVINIDNSTEVVLQPKVKIKDPVKIPDPPQSDNGQFKAEDDKVKGVDKTTDQLNIVKNANPLGKADSAEVKDPIIIIDPPPVDPKFIVTVPDKMPEFPGMGPYIASHLKFPEVAKDNLPNGMGTVYLTFVVELDGSISDVQVLKGIGYGCEQEAVRVVKGMPATWIPGMSKGKPCRSQCNLPIKFRVK